MELSAHTNRTLVIFFASLFLIGLLIDANSSFSYTAASGAVSDSYYIASFAKNIATGHGWATWNGEAWLPLDLHISTGPVVFLPLSALLAIGIPLDMSIPYAALAVNGLLLFALLSIWTILFSARNLFLLTLPILLFFLCFQRYQWYLCLGETSCTLLLLISTSCMAIKPQSLRLVAMAGVAAGAAMSSKLLGIFAIFALPLFLVLPTTRQNQATLSKAALLSCWYGGAAFVPFVTLTLMLRDYPADLVLERIINYLGLYTTQHGAVPLNPVHWLDKTVLQNPYWNFFHSRALWPTAFSSELILLLSVLPIVIFFRYKKPETAPQRFICFTAFLSTIYVIWFYFLGLHQQSRYLYIGGSLSFIALASTLIDLHSNTSKPFGIWLISLLTAALGFPWIHLDKGHPYVIDIKNMANTINNMDNIKSFTWITGGASLWPFPSYYLKSGIEWQQLARLLEQQTTFDEASYLAQLTDEEKKNLDASKETREAYFLQHLMHDSKTGHFVWQSPEKTLTLISKHDKTDTPEPVIRCAEPISENRYYLLAYCSSKEIEHAVHLFVGNKNLIIDAHPSSADH